MVYNAKVYRKQGGDELVVADGGAITVEEGGSLTVAGVTIDESTLAVNDLTASAAELNILDGATVTVEELNILDGAELDVDELNVLAGATPGTAVAGKAVVLDDDKVVDGILIILPTADPEIAGALWNNTGTITISTGP